MRMTERTTVLAVALWIALASLTLGQTVTNPFEAEPAPAAGNATPTPSPAAQPATGATNPFGPSAGAAAAQPASAAANPFPGPSTAPTRTPAAPSAESPFAPGAAQAPSPETTPVPGTAPGQAPAMESSTGAGSAGSEASVASDLGLTPAQVQMEIEKSKDKITDYYARGEYDKALREIDLLDKLSPGNPKGILVRHLINQRLLEGKPIGVPIRQDLYPPVPTEALPEGNNVAASGTPGLASTGAQGAVGSQAPAPPLAPVAPIKSGTSQAASGWRYLMPVVVGSALAVLAIITMVFFYTRRSRTRVQEAMAMARTSMADRPVGTPQFPSPVASPVPAAPESPAPPSFEMDAEAGPLPEPEPPPQEMQTPQPDQESQEEGLYDLPTMILTEGMMEGEGEAESAPPPIPPPAASAGTPSPSVQPPPPASPAQPAVSGDPFAAVSGDPFAQPATPADAAPQRESVPPPPSYVPPPSAALSPPPMPSESEEPEVHETEGGTFQPYGPPAGQSIGEVVGGPPSPGAPTLGSAPPLPELPSSEQSEQQEAPMAFAAGGEGSSLQLPDIFSADGTPIPGSQAWGSGEGGVEAASDFLNSAASLPSETPDSLSPVGASPASGPAEAPSSPSSTGTGDLSLNDLLFATSGGDTGMQTKTTSQASTGANQGAEGGASGEDLTQMSFGKEFDRLMFAQPEPGATDQTVSNETLSGGETVGGETLAMTTPGAKGQEDETLLDSLLNPGAAGSPSPAGAEDQTALLPGFPLAGSLNTAGAGDATVHLDPSELLSSVGPAPAPAPAPQPPAAPMDATVRLPPPPAAKTAPSASEEALYREDRQKGLDAFGAGDWKQAVHFLSVAASLHPEDKEVCQKLQEARKQRRSAAGI